MVNLKRIKITEEYNGIRLRIKPKKNWIVLCYIPLFLAAWTVGAIAVVNEASKGDDMQHAIAIAWMCFWVIIEAAVIFALLWNIFGEEVISIRGGLFTRQLAVRGVGIKKTFPAGEVFNIRTSGFSDGLFKERADRGWWLLGIGEETVAVDITYTMIFKFGIRLDEDEAASVANALRPYIINTSNNSFNRSAS